MRTCSRDGCDRKHHARGLCVMHYGQALEAGQLPPRQTTSRVCKIDGCEGKHWGRGFCQYHYNRFRETGDPLAPAQGRQRDPDTDPRDMSGAARAEFGATVSFENSEGRTLVLHRVGGTSDAIRACCDVALLLDATFRVVAISTPATVYSDMLQRLPNRRQGRQGFVQLPEAYMLAKAKMSHMLHPQLDRKNKPIHIDDDTWEPRTFADCGHTIPSGGLADTIREP